MSDENPIKRLNDLLDIAEKHGEWLKEIDTRVGALETNCEHSFAKVEDHVKRILELIDKQSDSIDMLDRFLKDVNIHHSALISRNNDKLAELEQKSRANWKEGYKAIINLESVLTSYNQLIWDILWTFDPNSTENPSERIKELRERLNALNDKLGGEIEDESAGVRDLKEKQDLLSRDASDSTPPRKCALTCLFSVNNRCTLEKFPFEKCPYQEKQDLLSRDASDSTPPRKCALTCLFSVNNRCTLEKFPFEKCPYQEKQEQSGEDETFLEVERYLDEHTGEDLEYYAYIPPLLLAEGVYKIIERNNIILSRDEIKILMRMIENPNMRWEKEEGDLYKKLREGNNQRETVISRSCDNCGCQGIRDLFMCPGKEKCILDRDWRPKEKGEDE